MSERIANLQSAMETMHKCKARHVDDKGELRYTTVLEIPPVDTVETAVQIAIAAEGKVAATMILKRIFKWVGIALAAFILYALSFGPVLHLVGARVGGGWPSLPPVVRFIYYPMNFVVGYLPHSYDSDYIYWWLYPANPSHSKKPKSN